MDITFIAGAGAAVFFGFLMYKLYQKYQARKNRNRLPGGGGGSSKNKQQH